MKFSFSEILNTSNWFLFYGFIIFVTRVGGLGPVVLDYGVFPLKVNIFIIITKATNTPVLTVTKYPCSYGITKWEFFFLCDRETPSILQRREYLPPMSPQRHADFFWKTYHEDPCSKKFSCICDHQGQIFSYAESQNFKKAFIPQVRYIHLRVERIS